MYERKKAMKQRVVKRIGNIVCSTEILDKLLPVKVGEFTRVLLNPIQVPDENKWIKQKKETNDNSLYGVVQDIAIYVSENMKDMRGLLLEYWKDYGFLFTACFLEPFISKEIKSVKDIRPSDYKKLWGYRGWSGDESYEWQGAAESLYDLMVGY